jgi:3-phenylpropionate/trans-cinnamate dioxygenase ferredoxin reductase component
MDAERVVIVGAGPAGLATARAYREHGGHGEVLLLGQEQLPPYQRPPLTKDFLRGELDADELPIEDEEWFAAHDVELRLGGEVSAIDAVSGRVALGDAELRADAIVLATGSEPTRPELPGMADARITTMRTRADSERIRALARPGVRVLVLGTGFIGCELAASLAMLDASVTLVGQERLPQLERLGEGAARRIAEWLEELDVRLVLGAAVRLIENGRELLLEGGSRLEAEHVVLASGVRPRVELAERAGLAVSDGAIVVDAQMRAVGAVGRAFAVGDVAFAENASAGRRLRVEHWGDALGQGEVAGRFLAGEDASWEDVPGFWSTIGGHTLKHAAWGDGYEQERLVEHPGGGFAVWYLDRRGATVGVLSHDRDADYELGRQLIAGGDPPP